jgi:hypothetical protein
MGGLKTTFIIFIVLQTVGLIVLALVNTFGRKWDFETGTSYIDHEHVESLNTWFTIPMAPILIFRSLCGYEYIQPFEIAMIILVRIMNIHELVFGTSLDFIIRFFVMVIGIL